MTRTSHYILVVGELIQLSGGLLGEYVSKAFKNLPFDVDITLLLRICSKKIIMEVQKDFATEICIVVCFIIIKKKGRKQQSNDQVNYEIL